MNGNYQFAVELVDRLNRLVEGEKREVARQHIGDLLDVRIAADPSLGEQDQPLVLWPARNPLFPGQQELGTLGLLNGLLGACSPVRIAACYADDTEELLRFALVPVETLTPPSPKENHVTDVPRNP